jgi:methanogenic corrinoid protein MtbC1
LRARVMVGGAPASQEWASEIGAHGYADNAVAAVAVARRLVTGEA